MGGMGTTMPNTMPNTTLGGMLGASQQVKYKKFCSEDLLLKAHHRLLTNFSYV